LVGALGKIFYPGGDTFLKNIKAELVGSATGRCVMGRELLRVGACVLLFLVLGVGIGVAPARATTTTYILTATPFPSYTGVASFWVTYTDTDPDNLLGGLGTGESTITGFSGVTINGDVFPADIPFASIPYVPGYVNGSGENWGWLFYYVNLTWFGTGTAQGNYFTYTIDPVPAVPVPPSVLLLGTGLIALAWARRKKVVWGH
jgi:hypothetical protein